MTIDTTKIDRMTERLEIKAEADRIRAIDAGRDNISKPFGDAIADLESKRDAAIFQYDLAHPVDGDWPSDVSVDGDGFPEVCCVSGLVLFDDDEVVEDSDNCKALRAAIPGWPCDDAAEAE